MESLQTLKIGLKGPISRHGATLAGASDEDAFFTVGESEMVDVTVVDPSTDYDPSILIKVSSRLINHSDVYARMRRNADEAEQRVVGGGGEQINTEFDKNGWPYDFGPFGRICFADEHREVAAAILERNAAQLADRLRKMGLPGVSVIVPVMKIDMGGVTCHVNGDFYPIIGYNGFKRSEVYTSEKDVERKRRWYMWQWQINKFHLGDRGEIPDTYTLDPSDYPKKIQVIGLT